MDVIVNMLYYTSFMLFKTDYLKVGKQHDKVRGSGAHLDSQTQLKYIYLQNNSQEN